MVDPNSVTAQCTSSVTGEQCDLWTNVAAQDISVQAPASPSTPVVALTLPSVISACANLAVDLSTSSGSGGRAWAQPTFGVTGDSDTSEMADFLNMNFSISPPSTIPARLLLRGGTFALTAKLCNFLGACGSGSAAVLVSPIEDLVPIVTIPGQRYRTTTSSTPLILSADARVVQCNAMEVRSGLRYTWTVFDENIASTTLSSESADPSKFRLSAHRLTPLHYYEIQLQVLYIPSAQVTRTSVFVFVEQSELRAVLKGGSSRMVAVGNTVRIDASASYDEDIPDATGVTAGLYFTWACVQIKPTFSATCPLQFATSPTGSTETISITAPGQGAINTVSTVTVMVTDATRSSSASVDITIIPSASPIVAITTAAQTVKSIRPENRLRLTGSVQTQQQSSCSAVWSVDDAEVTLSSRALTPIAITIPALTSRQLNFVLSANTMSPSAVLTFYFIMWSIYCQHYRHHKRTPITRHVCQYNPVLALNSSHRSPLQQAPGRTQSYHCSISSSLHPDLVAPAMPLAIRSEQPFITTNLAAGAQFSDHKLTATLSVFDALSASRQSNKVVTVRPLIGEEDIVQSSIYSSLGANDGNADASLTLVSVGSSILNTVNCSLAPVCAQLNRAACSAVAHTCGACLPNYVGDTMDSNELCILDEGRRRQLQTYTFAVGQCMQR